MIETIKHKGLRRLYENNDRIGIRPDLVEKAQKFSRHWTRRTARKTWLFPCFGFTR